MIGLEKIREESLYPLKQSLIGSRVKPEHSLKQCTSLAIITCSHIIKIAIITDMRSPDVIFGKARKLFPPNVIKLTPKEKPALRIPQHEPEVESHRETPQNVNLGDGSKTRTPSLGRAQVQNS